MHFNMKSYLKSNRDHTTKQALKLKEILLWLVVKVFRYEI